MKHNDEDSKLRFKLMNNYDWYQVKKGSTGMMLRAGTELTEDFGCILFQLFSNFGVH